MQYYNDVSIFSKTIEKLLFFFQHRLYEKFNVHNQHKKAGTLKKLVNRFLDIAAFEDRDHGQVG